LVEGVGILDVLGRAEEDASELGEHAPLSITDFVARSPVAPRHPCHPALLPMPGQGRGLRPGGSGGTRAAGGGSPLWGGPLRGGQSPGDEGACGLGEFTTRLRDDATWRARDGTVMSSKPSAPTSRAACSLVNFCGFTAIPVAAI